MDFSRKELVVLHGFTQQHADYSVEIWDNFGENCWTSFCLLTPRLFFDKQIGQEICDGSGAPGAHCRPVAVNEGEKRQYTCLSYVRVKYWFRWNITLISRKEQKEHVVLLCLLNNEWERWQIDIGCCMIFCDGITTDPCGRSFWFGSERTWLLWNLT